MESLTTLLISLPADSDDRVARSKNSEKSSSNQVFWNASNFVYLCLMGTFKVSDIITTPPPEKLKELTGVEVGAYPTVYSTVLTSVAL